MIDDYRIEMTAATVDCRWRLPGIRSTREGQSLSVKVLGLKSLGKSKALAEPVRRKRPGLRFLSTQRLMAKKERVLSGLHPESLGLASRQ